MELQFTRNTTIRDVKQQFSRLFHYLKLEFFYGAHAREESSVLEQKIDDYIHLGKTKRLLRTGSFVFQPSQTVAEFEQRFQNEFGLPVQVFRKAGNLWIETIQTDNLSLEQQNAMGLAASKPVRINLNSLFL